MIKKLLLGHLIGYRNKQLRDARKECRMRKEENSVLSAYLAILLEERGEIRVPRETVAEMIGHYRAAVSRVGDDYKISLHTEREGKEHHVKSRL